MLAAQAARAGTISTANGTVTYQSSAGEADDVLAEAAMSAAFAWQFTGRTGTAPTRGPGCNPPSGASIACSGASLDVRLDDRADRLEVQQHNDFMHATVHGGAGNDVLTLNGSGSASPGSFDVFGDGDDDTITVSGLGGRLDGGEGDDTFTLHFPLTAFAPGYLLVGGPGVDSVAHVGLTAPVFISLADQGSANGYGGIENVLTGSGNDRIEGSPAANRLDGAGGDDVLTGGGGADTLIGADGDDTLQASDGAVDSVNCGPGLDTATADTTDTLQGCESVTYTDNDRDGYSPPADCNDASAVINPSAFDAPANGVDENCDGQDAEVLDRDGDGFARPADCDDADAAVRPSALDRPGNGVDEDCNGRDAAYPRITSGVANSWRASARITRVVRLTVTEAPVGALVALRCSGHGCPRGVKRVRSSGARELRLASFFRGHLLRPGATVEIRITLPDTIGKLVRYRIRRGDVPKPTVLCVPPGASAPQSCIAIG